MSFRSFDGQATRTKRIALGGKSRAEESREQVLERTRLERERRKQLKLEIKGATEVQAAWRAWDGIRRHKAAVRASWVEKFGAVGELVTREDLHPRSGYLRQLCYFANPASPADVRLLASACSLVLASTVAPVSCQQQGQQQGLLLDLCSHAREGGEVRATLAQQTQQLVALALQALAFHAGRGVGGLGAALAAPRQGPAAAAAARGENVAAALLEAVIALAGVEAWKPFVPAGEAAALAAQVLAFLVRRGLFSHLASIVTSACPEPEEPSASPAGRAAVPAGEALATALVVRYMSLQSQVAARLAQPSLRTTSSKQGNPLRSGLAGLLCVPLLIPRCPCLRPLAGRLWLSTVAALQGLDAAGLAAQLPEDTPGGKASAAAALMGNLVDNTAAALKVEGSLVPPTTRTAAVQFVGVLSTLLQLLPTRPFFPQSAWADDEEGSALREYQGVPAAPRAQLAWDEEQLVPAGLVAQMQMVSDSNFLRSVAVPILAHTTSPPEAAAGDAEAAAAQQAQREGPAVRALCALLYRLMLLPGQRQRVLVGLAVRAELAQRLWFSYLLDAHAAGGEAWVPSRDDSCDPGWMLPLVLFCLAYSAYIITAGDEDVYERGRPLPLGELYAPERLRGGALALLKFALWQVLWMETAPAPGGWSGAAAGLRQALKEAAGKLMGQLYNRNCRRAFAPAEAFQADALPQERFYAEMQAGTAAGRTLNDAGSTRAWGLLTYAPFLVPFQQRAHVFQAVVSQERAVYRESDPTVVLRQGLESRFVTIRRNQMLADGYERLGALGEGLRGRVRVQFISEHGLEEAGVDGGGIFKEFLEAVVKEGFNPDLGLFLATTDQRLYPNPHVREVLPATGLRLLEFLGQMLGKAMYEGILVELPLAGFFLKKFRGMYCDIGDLPTLDPQLYKSLMFLKRYAGDVRDLGLTFTVADSVLGKQREVELVRGGADLAVTNDNVAAYIHRVADYKLNQQIREPTAAFLRGLHMLIQPEWVSMFNEEELQMLISGGQQGLDLEDMRAHAQYSGGYYQEHPVVQNFWRALGTLSPEEQGDFLRFVTSCPRPPLLGFKYLEPPLCIQMAGSVLDPRAAERLPTAATCMNLLKLPPYPSAQLIREKLLYAIKAGAGFELS